MVKAEGKSFFVREDVYIGKTRMPWPVVLCDTC